MSNRRSLFPFYSGQKLSGNRSSLDASSKKTKQIYSIKPCINSIPNDLNMIKILQNLIEKSGEFYQRNIKPNIASLILPNSAVVKRNNILESVHYFINFYHIRLDIFYNFIYFFDYFCLKNTIEKAFSSMEKIALSSLILCLKFFMNEKNMMKLSNFKEIFFNRFYSLTELKTAEITGLKLVDYNLDVVTPFNFVEVFVMNGFIFNTDRIDREACPKVYGLLYNTVGNVLVKNNGYLKYDNLHLISCIVFYCRQRFYIDGWPSILRSIFSVKEEQFRAIYIELFKCEKLKGKKTVKQGKEEISKETNKGFLDIKVDKGQNNSANSGVGCGKEQNVSINNGCVNNKTNILNKNINNNNNSNNNTNSINNTNNLVNNLGYTINNNVVNTTNNSGTAKHINNTNNINNINNVINIPTKFDYDNNREQTESNNLNITDSQTTTTFNTPIKLNQIDVNPSLKNMAGLIVANVNKPATARNGNNKILFSLKEESESANKESNPIVVNKIEPLMRSSITKSIRIRPHTSRFKSINFKKNSANLNNNNIKNNSFSNKNTQKVTFRKINRLNTNNIMDTYKNYHSNNECASNKIEEKVKPIFNKIKRQNTENQTFSNKLITSYIGNPLKNNVPGGEKDLVYNKDFKYQSLRRTINNSAKINATNEINLNPSVNSSNKKHSADLPKKELAYLSIKETQEKSKVRPEVCRISTSNNFEGNDVVCFDILTKEQMPKKCAAGSNVIFGGKNLKPKFKTDKTNQSTFKGEKYIPVMNFRNVVKNNSLSQRIFKKFIIKFNSKKEENDKLDNK